jgi:hypothetical protein
LTSDSDVAGDAARLVSVLAYAGHALHVNRLGVAPYVGTLHVNRLL